MAFELVAPNTTFCPNTPQNWRDFRKLAESISQPQGKNNLQTQLLSENKWLRQLRAFLPGYEPDR